MTTNRTMPIQIVIGIVTEKNNHVVITPSNKPKPPTRGTGTECNERELGWSSAQSVLRFINHKIEKKATANDSNAATIVDRGKPKPIMTGLSVTDQ